MLILLLVLAVTVTDRSAAVVYRFKASHICPATQTYSQRCPGYVVDHIVALRCGGMDHIDNLQYQTIAEGKAKDRWEAACARPSDQE